MGHRLSFVELAAGSASRGRGRRGGEGVWGRVGGGEAFGRVSVPGC